MRIADWQISACRGRRRSAGVVDADDNGYGVSHGHAMIGYDDGRVEACVAEESTIAASIITIATMPNTSSSYQPRNGNAIRHAMPAPVTAQPKGET